MSQFTLANVKDRIGSELGVSGWFLVDQARIDQFADCTGDRQWIHVDVERATDSTRSGSLPRYLPAPGFASVSNWTRSRRKTTAKSF